ncbi:putative nad-dependent epimerase [Diaporthe ampelina]|uniref:Putative nad-dependent epimerase n=1 Tax=Diaporthe ampelina TaxID=1214573 RepID=A0A0G2HWL6_9PEZI|nr:putative nad-dependent epimerase [Diaporthe ampelina]
MAPGKTYAVLGATGNCGTALIENLMLEPDAKIHAYCRNRSKLLKLLPDIKEGGRAQIFEGSIQDVDLLKSCIRDCHAVFMVVSTNDNIPGCHVAQDTARAVIDALKGISGEPGSQGGRTPRLVLLSSATIDDGFSRHVPRLLRLVLLRSASHVYADLVETERLLRAEGGWLATVFMKPGALSVDARRGHALSLTDEESPVSYLDLAAAMIEAVGDDADGRYDNRNVSVVHTNGPAKFPTGTPWCILMGLMRHFFPFLHPYLPANTGPR